MKLNSNFLMTAALLAVPMAAPMAAQAQFGAYGMFTESRLSGTASSPLAATGYTANNSVNPSGFTGGVQYDFRTYGPVRLGADLRGSLLHTSRGAYTYSVGAGAREYSVLGGLKASFHSPVRLVTPYAQLSAGLGRSDFGLNQTVLGNPVQPNPQALHSGFEYHVYAGADVHILPLVDFRAVELGYGGLSAGSHNYPILSVSTGIVFHLPMLQ